MRRHAGVVVDVKIAFWAARICARGYREGRLVSIAEHRDTGTIVVRPHRRSFLIGGATANTLSVNNRSRLKIAGLKGFFTSNDHRRFEIGGLGGGGLETRSSRDGQQERVVGTPTKRQKARRTDSCKLRAQKIHFTLNEGI